MTAQLLFGTSVAFGFVAWAGAINVGSQRNCGLELLDLSSSA